MPTLTSILSVKLLDGLSGPAAKAAGSLKALGRDAKSLDKIDVFKAQSRKLNEYSLALKRANQNLYVQKKALEAAGKPTASLQGAYDRAVRSADAAKAAFLKQGAAVRSTRADLASAGIAVNRLAADENRLRGAIERTTAAHAKQAAAAERIAKRREKARGAASTAAMVAGPGILRGAYDAAKAGAEIQSQMVKMRAAGIPESEIRSARAQSTSLASRYTNVGIHEGMEQFKDLRSILTHPEEVPHMMGTAFKALSALKALGQSTEGLNFAYKGAEVIGRAQDPKKFGHYIDSFIKAKQVMGGTITPEQMFEFSKYIGVSGPLLSDRFLSTTAMSLTQEMQSRAAQGLQQFSKSVAGGFEGNSSHAAARYFTDLGLTKKEDFEYNKNGSIKRMLPGRHVAGWQTGQSDPDKWVYDFLLPALEKHGIMKLEDQLSYVTRMFPQGRAADVVSKMITQRQAFETHAQRYGEAQGLDAAENNKTDPFVAAKSLATSLQNFAGVLTRPIMQGAAGTLTRISGSIGSWADSLAKWQENHKTAAAALGGSAIAAGVAGGGALTYGLISNLANGFGLGGSAAALSTSAAALTEAAVALGASGTARGLAGVGLAGGAAAAGRSVLSRAWLPAAGGVATAGGLGIIDPKGNFGGLTSGIDDTLRRAFGQRPSDKGITPGEIYEGIKGLLNGTAGQNPGHGASGSWGDEKPKIEKQGMFGDINISAPITINEAKDGKSSAGAVKQQIEGTMKEAFRSIQGDVGFSYS
ncbi:hypothetical protein AFEL58S_01626 [Afipia felis]